MLRRALEKVRACLPAAWSLEVREDVQSDGGRFDALASLGAPDGTTKLLVIEAKRVVASRDVPNMVERLRIQADRSQLEPSVRMLVGRYLAGPVRERLEREGVAYADATGNVRIEIDQPSLFLRNAGADRDPWRGPGRPRGSLKGAAAARVVRALVDFSPPFSVPQLVERSGASTGATYRVVKFLEEEDLLDREVRGAITEVRWRRLIERWSRDDGFMQSPVVGSFLFPRGVENVAAVLASTRGLRYVLTGSLAAASFAAYAAPRLAMIYVEDAQATAEKLGLRPVERGANILLAVANDATSFVRAGTRQGVVTAAPSQIAVDLLSGPGRLPSEGQAVLDWMEKHEREWRI